jgi:hypothetical protein
MKDTDDPIPVGKISMRDAVDAVYRAITPNLHTLLERLNPASPYYDGLPEQDAKCAREEAWRNHDKAQQRAIKRLRAKISQGDLIAQVRDPRTGDILKLDRDEWASMSDFEMEITIVSGARQTVFFDRKNFDDVIKGVAPPDSDRTAHAGEHAPAASKPRSKLQKRIREFDNQLRLAGFTGREKERIEEIQQKFKKHPPHRRTIERALKSK